ncbi:MAG: VWA domain-containing protein [Thermoanaerobaculia bacterium]
MTRIAAVAFVLACAVPAHAEWTRDYAAALARAKAERKIVLVDVRNASDAGHDKFIADSEAEPPMAHAFRAFVLARVDAGAAEKPPEVVRLLALGAPAPSLALVDPGGTFITAWGWFDNQSRLLNFLNMARRETAGMLDAFDVRERGAAGDADMQLADINLRLLQLNRARDLYRQAVTDFQKESQSEKAEKAAIGALIAEYMTKRDVKILAEMRKLARGSSPAVAASAYLAIGKGHLFNEEKSPAAAAFHDALTAAKEGSPESSAARDALLGLGFRVDAPAAASPDSPLRINVPPGTTLSGVTTFGITANASVVRVDWYVDGRAVRSTMQPPLEATIDLGATPRLHSIDAVAFAADGTPLSRATTTINDRLDELRVYIVSPAAEKISGRVRVEADAYVPPGRMLKRVEFFWNDQPIGTVSSPPYRLDFDAPQTFGYLRALGTLDDGRSAEDAHTFNASGFTETFDVHNIAFAATVVDREGNHVHGLTAGDFEAKDRRERVELAVREAPDEPATIGLAVDLSASMHRLLLPVMDIGSRLITSAMSGSDKMFLVTFDERPRLLQPLTGNRSLLRSRLEDAFAFGGTALADALAFAIQQFAGTTGRRALIIITDGNEGESTQRAEACLEMAKESGVPIYVIVPSESTDEDHVGDAFRKVLREMSNVTGGVMFLRPKREQIDAVVRQIRDEVRGQYLLSFSGHADVPGTWRALRISVRGGAATVRTISGYYVR